jgi:hypothetical protein
VLSCTMHPLLLPGQFVVHPVHGTLIPIVGDATLVDPALGTGAVKVTPAHDPNDFECGKRHGLPMVRGRPGHRGYGCRRLPTLFILQDLHCHHFTSLHTTLISSPHITSSHSNPLQVNMLNDDGTVNSVGGQFAGQDRFEVRKGWVFRIVWWGVCGLLLLLFANVCAGHAGRGGRGVHLLIEHHSLYWRM